MNCISTEQNSERQIQRLAAQRQLYATAKTIFGWQVVVSGPIAVVLALLVSIVPALKGYAALWGIILSLCDVFWLTPWQKRLRAAAAKVQELFDCEVLSLPWNEIKAGKRPDPELLKEQSDKYWRWGMKMPSLRDWYCPLVGDLPLHIARVACQRSNCWWDAKQRRRYAAWVIGVVVVVFVIVLVLATQGGLTVEEFVLKVAAPLSPAILLGFRQFNDQNDAANRLDKLKDHAERLWADALSGESEVDMTAKSRGLQDEILDNRKGGPLVLDMIYKHLQPSFQEQVNFGTSELVGAAKEKLGL